MSIFLKEKDELLRSELDHRGWLTGYVGFFAWEWHKGHQADSLRRKHYPKCSPAFLSFPIFFPVASPPFSCHHKLCGLITVVKHGESLKGELIINRFQVRMRGREAGGKTQRGRKIGEKKKEETRTKSQFKALLRAHNEKELTCQNFQRKSWERLLVSKTITLMT